MTGVAQLLHEKRFRRPWQHLLLLLCAVTAWFAFGPAPESAALRGVDKLHHVLAFGSMACVGALSLRPSWANAGAVGVASSAYGLLIEAVQTALPGRHADWRDLIADAIGIALGLLLVVAARRVFRIDT